MRSFLTSATVHALILGGGAAWGLLATVRGGEPLRCPVATIEPAPSALASSPEFDPELDREPEPELVSSAELVEPELVESSVWAEERPSSPRPWQEELRALDLEPPLELDLGDLSLSRGAASAREGASADPALLADRAAPVAGAPSPPLVEEPSLIAGPPPAYPRLSIRAGEEGTVLCRIHVGEDGAVRLVELVGSSGFERLDQAALRALERWRFEPRRVDGRPVAATIVHRVKFQMRAG